MHRFKINVDMNVFEMLIWVLQKGDNKSYYPHYIYLL